MNNNKKKKEINFGQKEKSTGELEEFDFSFCINEVELSQKKKQHNSQTPE